MPLIQIPLEPPPPQRPPEQGDLFEPQSWESAYREMHDFPTLLIQARDELARSRKREAFWMSLVAHLILVLLIVNAEKLEKYLPHRTVILVHNSQNNNTTFLELPPDLEKPVKPPKTNILSDKSRIAQSKAPKLDRQELKRLLDASRQGRPGPTAPAPQQQPAPPAQAQAQPQPQPQQSQPTPPPANTTARLQAPPVEHKSVFNSPPVSAGRAIEQAANQVAGNPRRYGGGDEGDLGFGQRQPTARVGPAEILSDTMGVDFGPYMQRVLHDVKQNWYAVIPESAMPPLLKKGKVSIEFAILKNGQIAGLRYVFGSGDIALDRAAYGGITASNPFPPLPSEYGGQSLALRFTFFYNPDPNEADLR